ncbi:hypothetical protein GQ53DRAFT_619991, partial [Thozetella sp. PMI_491]
MGTTYQLPNLASYENHSMHHHSSFASTLSHPDRTRPAPVAEHVFHPNSRFPPEGQLALPHPSTTSVAFAPAAPHTSQTMHSRSSTPGSSRTMPSGGSLAAQLESGLSARDSVMVLHSLTIPACISPKGGSLVDFAAQITALFWFESIKTLEAAEKVRSLAPGSHVRRLTDNAIASPHFKKWVHSVLSTTQVTQNVILLALMFIYRLKVANPTVRGRPGSEYRLLTVALMLGNKFLDDNTYTNKTWAEVSGIAVGEIHVMEVEFLSNMRYSLLASKEQWEEWLAKLAKFWEYCERAQQPVTSPLIIPSPNHRGFASPLPSPTGNLQLTPNFQPTPTAGNKVDPAWQHPGSSPLSTKRDIFTRKRFPEEDLTEPPAKRLSRQPDPALVAAQHAGLQQHPIVQPMHQRPPQDTVRLPVPNLTLNTTNIPSLPVQSHVTPNYAPQQASALSLPPLVAGVRAMATVYPTTTYAAQLPVPATSGPVGASNIVVTPTNAFPPVTYSTPTKRMSPQNSLTPVAAYNSSPLADNFAHHALTPLGNMGTASGAHTPIGHSPSIYLQQRPSPYKPVRHVNTLLYPPPSAFLQQYHLANQVPPTQMHYQPLGRRNEFRTGIVPEFAMASHGL